MTYYANWLVDMESFTSEQDYYLYPSDMEGQLIRRTA